MATKKRAPKKNDDYTVTLTLGPNVYKSASPDPTAAILGLKPAKISSRAVFAMEFEGKTASFLRNVTQTRRILSNRLNAFILGRNLTRRLK